MTKDYLAVLAEIPAKHGSLVLGQIAHASIRATSIMRAYGLRLPGSTTAPTATSLRHHLGQMVNRALDGYFSTKDLAPAGAKANEVWGEDCDALFSVTVSGLSEFIVDGFTAEIDMNLLYLDDEAAS